MNTKFLRSGLTAYIAIVILCASPITNAKEKDTKHDASTDFVVKELKTGNQRFLTGNIRKDGQSNKDIERLSTAQNPRAIVLSCSDSRVPPEAVFDQRLGEMFTVRSAGETLSPQAIGSIEYALEKFSTPLIVVLGHTNCGAVKAAAETIDGKTAGSENLDLLVKDIHPRIKEKFDSKHPSKDYRDESWLNARGVAKDLAARSKIISRAIETGKTQIKVGLYDLATGKVEFE